jgi:hypothetical protein
MESVFDSSGERADELLSSPSESGSVRLSSGFSSADPPLEEHSRVDDSERLEYTNQCLRQRGFLDTLETPLTVPRVCDVVHGLLARGAEARYMGCVCVYGLYWIVDCVSLNC